MQALNFSQKNSLFASLYGFEVSLHQIEKWLEESEERGIIYLRTLRLTPEVKRKIHAKIKDAYKMIEAMKQQYDLPKREEGLAEYIISMMSISWADLEDAKARNMKNYGEINEEAGKKLDEDLEPIIKIARSIFNIVDQNRQPL